MLETTNNSIKRPPVVAVMGHIDHGKSTLLDYIRKTNIVESEFGGITQHISAYEVEHKREGGTSEKITFLDTPGHAAFEAMRARGAAVADIAILVVSAEDGVKPQTLEAFRTIESAKIPYIVAINKIDKPNANIEKTKASLAENGIFIEGYGGNTPAVSISAKTGQNVNELLDMIILIRDIEDLRGDKKAEFSGVIIESSLDERRGILATVIIKNGTIKSDECAVAGKSFSPVRMMEDFNGKKINEATFSSPIRIIGWSEVPQVGSEVFTCGTKKEAEALAKSNTELSTPSNEIMEVDSDTKVIPIIVKSDVAGVSDAIVTEISKINVERIKFKILKSEAGIISENDVKTALAFPEAVIVGFNVKVDSKANELADRSDISIKTFNVIYKLTEWLNELAITRKPRKTVLESVAEMKVLKFFSETKNKQVIGCRVLNGIITTGDEFVVTRRDDEIGSGKIGEIQQNRSKVSSVNEGEFGVQVESKVTVAPGDILKIMKEVEK